MNQSVVSASFKIEVNGGHPSVTREVEFPSGDTASFAVTLERDDTMTMPQLHRQSVECLIAQLQAWIAQE